MRPGLRAGHVAVVALAALVALACGPSQAPPRAPDAATASTIADRLARRCTKIASCAHAHDAPRERDPSQCVDWWIVRGAAAGQEGGDAFAKCVDAAATCAALDACDRDRGDQVAASYCRAHADAQTACEGTRFITCAEDDPEEGVSVDCASLAATCGTAQEAGGLLARGCLSPTLCPAGAPEARCEGGAIVTCHEGMVERIACGPGIGCEQHKDAEGVQAAVCAAPGHGHCDRIGERRCEGTRLVQCVPHGRFGERRATDCAALGMTCDASSPKPACVVEGPRVPCATGARCDGEALAFCAAGKPVAISCASLGFPACNPDAHGLEPACATPP